MIKNLIIKYINGCDSYLIKFYDGSEIIISPAIEGQFYSDLKKACISSNRNVGQTFAHHLIWVYNLYAINSPKAITERKNIQNEALTQEEIEERDNFFEKILLLK